METEQNSNNNKCNATPLNLKELFKMYFDELVCIAEGLLYQGVAILAGPPKLGKSWLVLALCIAISKGQEILGFHTNQCGCLYLSLEDSLRRIKDRSNNVLQNDNAIPDNIYPRIKCPTIDEGLTDYLQSELEIHPDIKFIVIDTFQKICSGNINSYNRMSQDVGKLKEFADDNGVCILLIHHSKKSKSRDVFNEIQGSIGINGTVDTMIVLTKSKDNPFDVVFSATGRDIENIEKVIRFNKKKCQWEVIAEYESPEDKQYQDYIDDPIVITVKHLLSEQEEVIITATDLYNKILEINGMDKTDLKQKNGQAVSRELNNNLQIFLKEYDNIRFERVNTSGGTEGRQIKFSFYPVEDESVQQEEISTKENIVQQGEVLDKEIIPKQEIVPLTKQAELKEENTSKVITDSKLF